ncbi:MAG: PDZ domain-containing protein [Acidobacteria bacterium]|nr:PDZ domain-containing protein [Acidobacteriota bacterium]
MQFKTKIAIVVFSTIVACYAIIGSFMSRSSQAVARGTQYAQSGIFDDVLKHIVEDYVEEPDLEKVRLGSLRGLAEGLDPYSAYLTPDQAKQYNPKTAQGETGLIVSKVAGFAYVVAVLKGSPAEQSGIHEGDFIEYIGKLPSRDLSLYETQQLINGAVGSTVELKVLHRGQSRKVTVTRGKVAQPAIEARLEEPGIGYLKITSLVDGKANEIKTQLSELLNKGAQKIVLDLRGAANGTLDEGVAVANYFVGNGTLARIIGKGGKETKTYTADAKKVLFNGPLAVLIDSSTAGAAEVIAAAVRDQKRGDLVGLKTFGIGSEQQLFSLSDGGALLITVAKYAPGNGKPFMDEPINPTEKVERLAEPEVVLPDGDDDNETTEPSQPQTAPKPEAPPEDVQLKKAVEILKRTAAKAQSATKTALLKAPVSNRRVSVESTMM